MKSIFLTLFGVLITISIISACKKNNGDGNKATLKVALASPDDGGTVSSTGTTQFSWTASSSNPAVSVMSRFSIVQVTGDQTPANAIHTNKPFFEKDSLNELHILYPVNSGSPGFTPGSKYAWQVTVRQPGLVAMGVESTIRTFTVPNTLKVTLTSPTDGSTIANTGATQFSWTALSSNKVVPVTYKISIVQVTGDQTPDNAIHTNKPFFEKDSLNDLHIQYPSTVASPGFTAGGKYAWQVTAKQAGLTTEGGTSALAVFNISK